MRSTILLAVMLACPVAAQETSPVQEWIASHAIRLSTPEAGHGFTDLEPLRQAIGNARIVSLGEATHGTREFFQLKHRMLEFLVGNMGFSIFSIEANMPEAYRLNDYVLNGNGDPAALIKGMYFWTWDTKEVLDMVLWMREFNKSGKGRVEFTGFDMQTPDVANGIVRDFVSKMDPDYAPELARASEMALAPSAPAAAFGTANGIFPAEKAAGKTLQFSGYIKTENVSKYAGFWWRADDGNKALAFADLGSTAPKGTTDWKRYQLTISVPAATKVIYFGALLAGSGTAWYDDLQIDIDGTPYSSDDYDFGFEGARLKGLYPAVPPYVTRVDDQVAHGGKKSLRISSTAVAAPVNSKVVDPKIAAAEWTKVVEHMESSREKYANAAKKDVEWAIQNARVVLQCMQMRAKQVTRDDSMAANVKWILDQSPGAKMVVWAHNGHVETANGSMGSALRRAYGDQMVVFGFAFNQGSFQSRKPNGPLTKFTVAPAPGSLDAMLASTGIPLFALDLRKAPKTGAVADWFQSAHTTRSIGAIYSEDAGSTYLTPQIIPERCDALLFVEKTTSAVANVRTFDFKAADGTSGVTEFRDPEYGVSVEAPNGWMVGQAFRWGDHETTVHLTDPAGEDSGSLYFKIAPSSAKSDDEAYRLLLAKVEDKVAQRAAAGLPDYQIRPGSVERRTVGGKPAVRCIADFTRDGAKWIEYLTWVSGDNASALFFAQAPASDLDATRKRLDPIVETLKLP